MSDTELVEALARELTFRSEQGWIISLAKRDGRRRHLATGFGHSAYGETAADALRRLLEFVAQDQVTEGRG